LINTILLLLANKDLKKVPEVLNQEKEIKTTAKGEELLLHSSESLFSESVLCSIWGTEKITAGTPFTHNVDFGKLVFKLTLPNQSESVLNLLEITEYINMWLHAELNISDEYSTYIISGNVKKFITFREYLKSQKSIVSHNILALKMIEEITSIIPQYGVASGNLYFNSLVDKVATTISPYQSSIFNIQLLSDDSGIMEIEDAKKIQTNRLLFYSMDVYLIIDNPEDVILEQFNINSFNNILKVLGINRYIVTINYALINTIIKILSSGTIISQDNDKAISLLREIIPQKIMDQSDTKEDDPYSTVDEIIQ
jgi:hypothetical protein